MSKPRQIHTIASLRERTLEEGDCWLWQAYIQRGMPCIYHDGRMVSVRRLLLALLGRPTDAAFVGTRCGSPFCINPAHFVERTMKQHATARAKRASDGPIYQLRLAKLTRTKRATTAKINMEIAREIRASEESGPVLAARHGVDRSLIGRIRRGEAWRDGANPFAAM